HKIVANGKHNHSYSTVGSSHNQLSNQKVRNRRGAKQQQPISNGNLHQHRRNQSKSTTSEPSSKSQQPETSSKHHHSNGSLDFDFDSNSTVTTTPITNHHRNSSSWSHLTQSEFVRQDSSSSEHSNRSSDSSSFSTSSISKQTSSSSIRLNQSNVSTDKKSHLNDSLDEMATNTVSNNNSGNNSPNASRQGKKNKRESSASKSTSKLQTSKTMMEKTPQTEQTGKKQPSTVNLKVKSVGKNLDNGKKEKSSSKCNSVSESLKSSQESLLSSSKFEQPEQTTINQDFMPTIKTRSATLPFTQNDSIQQQQSKPTNTLMAINDSSMYVSESNLSWNNTSSTEFPTNLNENENHFNSFRNVSPFKPIVEQNYSSLQKSNHNNKDTRFDTFRTAKEFNHNIKSGSFGYFGLNDKNNNGKDIWDSPITSFDTELAMNQLVKQTEEFAAIDDKVNASNCLNNNRPSFSGQRRSGGNVSSGNSRFQTSPTITDDKWEIGEWSNDLLDRCPSTSSSSSKVGAFGISNGNGYESTMAQMKKYPPHHSRFPQSINYQEYRNSLNDKNNSSRIYGKQLLGMNDSNMTHINSKSLHPQTTTTTLGNNVSYVMPRTISPQSTTKSPPTPVGLANVQSSLSLNSIKTPSTSPTSISTTTTFSPIIGRPTNAQQQQQQQQSSILSIQRNKLLPSPPTDSNHFSMLNSCLEKPLNPKSPLSLLPPFNSSSKNLLGQLDSLLEPTSKSQSFVYEQQQSSVSNSLCGKAVNTQSTVNVNSLLQTTKSSPWNSEFNPTLDSFIASASSSGSTSAKAVGSEITGMFTNLADHRGHQDSVWPSTATESTWPTSITSTSNTNNIFSNFSDSGKSPVNTFSSGLSPIESSSANRINWLTANSSAPNNRHPHTMIGPNNSTQTPSQSGGMWSAFDSPFHNYHIQNNTFNANDNVDFNSLVKAPSTANHHHNTTVHPDPVGGVSSTPIVSSAAAAVSTSAAFVDNSQSSSTIFELFGGKSPWAPLGSSPPNNSNLTTVNSIASGGETVTNFLSPSPTSATTSELLFGRLSQNSSPVSSSNGSTTSASSNSSNLDRTNSSK
ncbi:hypothetical protein BLA29_000780, partial [Euroglyphus maynei]